MLRTGIPGALTLVLFAATLSLVACGSSSSTTKTSFNESGDARYTEQQVAELAGFKADSAGLAWTDAKGCQIAVIMTTRAAVELYAGAGDPVVTNPAGDVGVKFYPDPGCREALAAELRNVK